MLRIYGASDDLVEVEGDITEEFSAADGDVYIATSSGAVLVASFGRSGVWRISVLHSNQEVHIAVQKSEDRESGSYSDVATIEASEAEKWVIAGEYAAAKPTKR